jgi:hypothetical protein
LHIPVIIGSQILLNGLLFANDNSFEKPSVGDVLGDVLCIRPLGFIEIAFNSLFFVISLPVTIPLEKSNEAEEFFIKNPYTAIIGHPFFLFTPAAESHGLWPWMNAPALGRDVAPLGRSLGATGFARGAPLYA